MSLASKEVAQNAPLTDSLKRWTSLFYLKSAVGLETIAAPTLTIFYLQYCRYSFLEFSLLLSMIATLLWIIEVPVGALADKFGRKPVLILGSCFYLLAMGALLVFKRDVPILVTALFFAIGTSASTGTFQSMMFQAFDSAGRQLEYHSVAAKGTTISLYAASAAAIVGGALSERSLALPMVVDMFLMGLVTLALALYVQEPSNPSKSATRPALVEIIREATKQTVSSRELILIIFCSALCFAALRTGFNFYQPMLSDTGTSYQLMGVCFAGFSLFSAVAAHFFSKAPDEALIQSVPIALMAIFFFGASLIAWQFGTTTIGVILAILCHQVCRAMSPSFFSFAINRRIPTDSSARTTVLSISSLVRAIVLASVLALSGLSGETFTYSISFFILSLVVGGTLFVVYLTGIRKVKKQ